MSDQDDRAFNPYQQLLALEQRQKRGSNKPADDEAYRGLVDVLRQLNDDPKTLRNLVNMATQLRSEGAAFALQGTPDADAHNEIRRHIRAVIEEAPTSVHKHETDDIYILRPTVLPLSLAGSPLPSDIDLLCRAAAFRRTRTPVHKGDEKFRINAVRALSGCNSEQAHESLFSLLCSPETEPELRHAVTSVFQCNCTSVLYDKCTSLLGNGRREAVRNLARFNGCGQLRTTWDSLFRMSRYEPVITALEFLTPGRQQYAVSTTSQTPQRNQ